MDAVEFLKERRRMCNAQDECGTCLIKIACEDYFVNHKYTRENADNMVAAVEQWSKEHPVKTRQSEFLNMFPNAFVKYNGVLSVLPCHVDRTVREACAKKTCIDCRREFWMQEVE